MSRFRRYGLPALVLAVLLAGAAVLWLQRLSPPQIFADADDPALVAQGTQLYATNCAGCHGAGLEGQANWRSPLPDDGGLPAPPHNADGHTHHHPDSVLFAITKFGGQAAAPEGFRSNMPAFSDLMTDQEILAALAFIKSSWPSNVRAAQQRTNQAALASQR